MLAVMTTTVIFDPLKEKHDMWRFEQDLTPDWEKHETETAIYFVQTTQKLITPRTISEEMIDQYRKKREETGDDSPILVHRRY